MHKQFKQSSITTTVVSVMLLMTGGVVNADTVIVPNTFVANSPATAASVNQNFGALETAVVKNISSISVNTTGTKENASKIISNTEMIGKNSATIGVNTSATAKNTATTAKNGSLIGVNTESIGNNTASTAKNAAAIGVNTEGIGKNSDAISVNTTSIGLNSASTARNASAIDVNTQSIGHNTEAIGHNAFVMGENTQSIGLNTGSITQNSFAIDLNTGSIHDNSTMIFQHAGNIEQNSFGIGLNTQNIGANTQNIGANTGAIDQNAFGIGLNTENIGLNTQSIGQISFDTGVNSENIIQNLGMIDQNMFGISQNMGMINQNILNIDQNMLAIHESIGLIDQNRQGIEQNMFAISENMGMIGQNEQAIFQNMGMIEQNMFAIGENGQSVILNTSTIDNHEVRITNLEAGVGGEGGGSVTEPVFPDCTLENSVQSAINSAPEQGRLVVVIEGPCLGNVVITRDDVTLIGDITGGSITGATSAPTISASQASGFEIENLTIGGGSQAVVVENGSNIRVTNSTIGNDSTLESGFIVLSSIARFVGGSSGNSINGGTTADESSGIQAAANSMVQFVSGSNVVNAGTGSPAIECELASSVVAGDLQTVPFVTVNGSLDFVENCYLGMFNGSITGDIYFANNSTLTLEAYQEDQESVSVTGNINIDSSSSALMDGDGVAVTGDVLVQRSSTASLNDGAMVSGKVQVRASSGIVAYTAQTIGTLECDTYSGNYVDASPDVAANFLLDGQEPFGGDGGGVFACGFFFPVESPEGPF